MPPRRSRGGPRLRWTPLRVAVAKGRANVAALLHERGGLEATLDTPDQQTTLLLDAVKTGDVQQARAQIAAGADVNAHDEEGRTSLQWAAIMSDADLAKILLSAGADVNAPDENGATSLHLAALGGHADVAKILLAAGVDVNARPRNNDAEAPLHRAALNGQAEVADLLRAHGNTE